MKKSITRILSTFISVLFIFATVSGCSSEPVQTVEHNTTVATTSEPKDKETESDVVLSGEVISMAEDTQDSVAKKEDVASDELAPIPQDESDIVDEGAIEPDAQVEQENISYDGTNTGKGTKLLGSCTGLTYFSQADRRWATMLYTSTGNRSQTMKSSACGPTCAAMIVSSSKGAILPPTMAQLFVDNGYRTANNGTAWACWSFVADYFDFKDYKTATSFSTVERYLEKDSNKDGVADYLVVASVGSGLFTTGGHYICLMADSDNTITVYDPYLYSGKFNTASRRAANVTVSGNCAYVSESNFRKYANAQQYWIFSNDFVKSTPAKKNTAAPSTAVKYTRYVSTQSSTLNVRSGAGTGYAVISSIKKGTAVTVTKTSGSWSYITYPMKGWVSTAYLSSAKVNTPATSTVKKVAKPTAKYTVGKSYRLQNDLKVRTGAGTNYAQKKRTQLTASGRSHALPGTYAVLKKGTVVTVQQIKYVGSDIWIKIPSGWIAAQYKNNIYVK